MTNTKKKLNNHREMVIKAMETNPECRNDDTELVIQVLSDKGINLTESQKYAIKTCGVEFKTLLRQRQRLQSEGKYLPTKPEIMKRRRKLAVEYTEHYSEVSDV
jgi:hypothetical protein